MRYKNNLHCAEEFEMTKEIFQKNCSILTHALLLPGLSLPFIANLYQIKDHTINNWIAHKTQRCSFINVIQFKKIITGINCILKHQELIRSFSEDCQKSLNRICLYYANIPNQNAFIQMNLKLLSKKNQKQDNLNSLIKTILQTTSNQNELSEKLKEIEKIASLFNMYSK